MDCSNSASASSVPAENTKFPFVLVRTELYSLLRPIRRMQIITTLDEVLAGLKLYIFQKNLFDPLDPTKICCKNDKLSLVFGASEFTIPQVNNFLPKLVKPISNTDYMKFMETYSLTDRAQKRKIDGLDDDVKKKLSTLNPTRNTEPPPLSPMFLHSSSSEHIASDCESIKNNNTDEIEIPESIVAVEEIYDLEYDVDSDSSSSEMHSDNSESDTDSEIEDALKTAIITLVCCTDSDMEFWADNSSEDENDLDAEIPESDKWRCDKCSSLNKPLMRYCLKCWDQRQFWFPQKHNVQRCPPKRKLRSKGGKLGCKSNIDECRKTEEASVSSNQYDVASTSQESLGTSYSSQEITDFSSGISARLSYCDKEAKLLCMLCSTKPANASIIHRKFAHQISCYECARKLQKEKKRCPVCYRKIDKVVYQISAV